MNAAWKRFARGTKGRPAHLDGWSEVSDDDLRQFRAQAEYEDETDSKRDRPTLSETFAGLASLATMELDARSSGGHPTLYMTLEAPLDETSGDEANKDDIAVIMIRALAHMRNERVPINSASPGECCHWSSRPAA